MSFFVNNPHGTFNGAYKSANVATGYSAEGLLSLPSVQFAAATLEDITNYDRANFSRFTLATYSTSNLNGKVKTRADKGFGFEVPADANVSQVILFQRHNDSSHGGPITFTLMPGDKLKRDGGYSTISYLPAGGDAEVTVIPWMYGWRSTVADNPAKFSHKPGNSWSHDYEISIDSVTILCDDPNATRNPDSGECECNSGYEWVATGPNTGVCQVSSDGGNGGGNGGGETGNGAESETNWSLWIGVGVVAAVGIGAYAFLNR